MTLQPNTFVSLEKEKQGWFLLVFKSYKEAGGPEQRLPLGEVHYVEAGGSEQASLMR